MIPSDTELRLSFWRDGQTKSERLAAAALRLSGFEEIDPQSPLGGPDGKKDIVCKKGGVSWVGAVYFPTAPRSFKTIKGKFLSDLQGMPAVHKGFAFVTNQNLTPKQRESLEKEATTLRKEVVILHLQRLQNLLDSPLGYGTRIQYLKIPMTIEEQLSWASDSDTQTAKALADNTRELFALRASIERMRAGQENIRVAQEDIVQTLGLNVATSAVTPDLISVSSFIKSDELAAFSITISSATILAYHRLTCFDLPTRTIGQFRSGDVWLGNMDGVKVDHIQPPPSDQVPSLLVELCDNWQSEYKALRTKKLKLTAIAKFHAKFLGIHPFLDGNGRVARAILMQQCVDLFGKADMSLMQKGREYYAALKLADKEDYEKLTALIEPIVK